MPLMPTYPAKASGAYMFPSVILPLWNYNTIFDFIDISCNPIVSDLKSATPTFRTLLVSHNQSSFTMMVFIVISV